MRFFWGSEIKWLHFERPYLKSSKSQKSEKCFLNRFSSLRIFYACMATFEGQKYFLVIFGRVENCDQIQP